MEASRCRPLQSTMRTQYTTACGESGLGQFNDPPQTGFMQTCARYRLLEFAICGVMMMVAGLFAVIAVYPRAIPGVEVKLSSKTTVWARDPTLDRKKMKEQVPMVVLTVLGICIPLFTNLVMNYAVPKCRRSIVVTPHDTRDFLLSLVLSIGLSQLITQFLKNMAGRFRPCFYDMCKWDTDAKWDGMTNLCQDKAWEKEGRKSFPSGHASFSWSTLFLLTLYLMGRSRLNARNREHSTLRGAQKLFLFFMCFIPTLLACWIAVTRSIDNWHNYSDIMAGSCIGAFAAFLGYFYNYSPIFSWDYAGVSMEQFHIDRMNETAELNATKPNIPTIYRKRTDSVPIALDHHDRAVSLMRLASDAVSNDSASIPIMDDAMCSYNNPASMVENARRYTGGEAL